MADYRSGDLYDRDMGDIRGGQVRFNDYFAVPATEPELVAPVGGAGLFDVDPDQGDVSQDPTVAIHGDVASLPEDMEV